MRTIDLHVHSTYSDGTFTPAELIQEALAQNLSAIALTDHDTIAGIADAQAAVTPYEQQLELIPGTELSVAYENRDIHIIGLFIDPMHEGFRRESAAIVARRLARNQEMIQRFQADGIPITMEQLCADNPDTVVTRAHFARVLITLGYAKDSRDAFRKYLDADTPYYVPRKYISQEDAIALIRDAGGIAILAHPLQYKLDDRALRTLLGHLTDYGLQGIEVKYSTHSHQDETYVRLLAKQFGLLPSGGSDFHGNNKPHITLGKGMGNLSIPYDYLEQLRKASSR
ncbi:MAG: PHP domain-containing protein [Eubacteriales bacterium]|nr:PHP domain-containing protein [Eubacteriales bacterium]